MVKKSRKSSGWGEGRVVLMGRDDCSIGVDDVGSDGEGMIVQFFFLLYFTPRLKTPPVFCFFHRRPFPDHFL